MPPCKNVLLKKIERTDFLSKMIKNATSNNIGQPTTGWMYDENGDMQLEYFSGNPFPENISQIPIDRSQNDDDDEDGSVCSSSDEEIDEDEESEDEWVPKKT